MEHGSYKLYFLVIDCSLSTLILYFLPFLIIFPFIPSFHPPFLRSLFLLSSHSTFPSFSYILSFPPHFTPVLLPFPSFPFLSFPFLSLLHSYRPCMEVKQSDQILSQNLAECRREVHQVLASTKKIVNYQAWRFQTKLANRFRLASAWSWSMRGLLRLLCSTIITYFLTVSAVQVLIAPKPLAASFSLLTSSFPRLSSHFSWPRLYKASFIC